jgi:hypothetical protein
MSDTKKVAFLVAGEGVERAELVEAWAAADIPAFNSAVLEAVRHGVFSAAAAS